MLQSLSPSQQLQQRLIVCGNSSFCSLYTLPIRVSMHVVGDSLSQTIARQQLCSHSLPGPIAHPLKILPKPCALDMTSMGFPLKAASIMALPCITADKPLPAMAAMSGGA